MASKRPCAQQQPGVVDEMANAIVRQVKAQRVVVNKGPVYQCGPVRIWRGVASEQRGYILGYKAKRVIFSSAKQAAEALVSTLLEHHTRFAWAVDSFGWAVDECIYLKGAGTLAILKVRIPIDEPQRGECTVKAVAAVEQLLTSNGVQLVEE